MKKKLSELQFLITEILLVVQLIFLFVMFVLGAIIIWRVA